MMIQLTLKTFSPSDPNFVYLKEVSLSLSLSLSLFLSLSQCVCVLKLLLEKKK